MYKKPLIQPLRGQSFAATNICANVLRLDVIHPYVSGNKWYKLKYHIAEALSTGKKGLASFGGAYSNHLVALAFACREQGLAAVGIIRGEAPGVWGPSLLQMKELGMELKFVSREEYKHKELLASPFEDKYHIVPEGGSGKEGVSGAAEILKDVPGNYTHIICAVGTGTTLAGIVNASACHQQVVGVSSLKVQDESNNQLLDYIDAGTIKKNYSLLFGYHFGGYAKKNDILVSFMNHLFETEGIATDFVYTGKLFYAVHDMISRDYFAAGSRILIVHSGGLQGNRGLPEGTLKF